MSRVWHEPNPAAIRAMLTGPDGAVARDMMRRGLKVETRAKRNLAGGPSGPRRIDTGRLRSSITTRMVTVGGAPAVRVGTNVRYAILVHEGTGVWGPTGQPIRPRRARVLVFTNRAGQTVVARQVRGMEPNRFLSEALAAARD